MGWYVFDYQKMQEELRMLAQKSQGEFQEKSGETAEQMKQFSSRLEEQKAIALSALKPNCTVRANAVSPSKSGVYPGRSDERVEALCKQDEKLISGGCEVIGNNGTWGDFGGVDNVGFIANHPNKNGNGWTCGFFGGFGGEKDTRGLISPVDKGIWDLNAYAYCCGTK